MFFIPAPFVLKPFYALQRTWFRTTDANVGGLDSLAGYNYPFDTTKTTYIAGSVPMNFQAGEDADLLMVGAPVTLNDSGSEKFVCIITAVYYARLGGVGAGAITPTKVQISIPNNEAAKTVHRESIAVISGLVKGDNFGVRIRRAAAEPLDTYDHDFFMHTQFVLRYIADKVGVEV